MKALNYFNPKYFLSLLVSMFCKTLLSDSSEVDKKYNFVDSEPLSDLEVIMQWEEFTNALENNIGYLNAVKSLETEPFLQVDFKPKQDYLIRIVLSPEMIHSLTARYSNPSDCLLN